MNSDESNPKIRLFIKPDGKVLADFGPKELEKFWKTLATDFHR